MLLSERDARKSVSRLLDKPKKKFSTEAGSFAESPIDVVEWRADWYEDVFDTDKVLETAKELNTVLKDTPILFTFRTAKEGGEKAISNEAYQNLNLAVAKSGFVDLIDVEAFTGDEIVTNIISKAHDFNVKVVSSNHDFDKTPEKEELIRRLCRNLMRIFQKLQSCQPADVMCLCSLMQLLK